ncbi:unnamed protein product [Haemonchus placei]|uniref:Protein kish n=1 Tax=Haemonchus placei TaxID=6290 RepID=A0A0N4X8I4_HAEPC|nr:unnamed protein product [Haemonchus placei]
MDELLAIIVIVILCCVMFFAWLVSMATCPDAMVSFLSGSRLVIRFIFAKFAGSRTERVLLLILFKRFIYRLSVNSWV